MSLNIVGRDPLIESIWRKLDTHSLELTAERRIGKTYIMQAMQTSPKEGYAVIYIDLEKLDSLNSFVTDLTKKLAPLLTTPKQVVNYVSKLKLIKRISSKGLDLNDDIQTLDTLDKYFKQIGDTLESQKLVLLLDELPYLLQKIIANPDLNNNEARNLLDCLRALRAENNNLRMVFAGSIGLHHVLRDLKNTGVPSQPTNDLHKVEIHPLEDTDAVFLANQLLQRELIHKYDVTVPDVIAQCAGNVPFYIQKIIYALETQHSINEATILDIFKDQLNHAGDPWQMNHFRERLNDYYQGNLQDTQDNKVAMHQLANNILDTVSKNTKAASKHDIWSAITSHFALQENNPTHKHAVNNLLTLLIQDHYLIKGSDQNYRFRYSLIKSWWVQSIE